jgi:hypothetical protein
MNNCQWCNQALGYGWQGKRWGSKFCNDECRTKYHNARKKTQKQAQNIIIALGEIEELITKGGELGELALHTIRRVRIAAEVSSTYQCYCKSCGQNRLFFPMPYDKCDFCGKENWGFKDKEPEKVDLHESKE